jgi:hypothetical protein
MYNKRVKKIESSIARLAQGTIDFFLLRPIAVIGSVGSLVSGVVGLFLLLEVDEAEGYTLYQFLDSLYHPLVNIVGAVLLASALLTVVGYRTNRIRLIFFGSMAQGILWGLTSFIYITIGAVGFAFTVGFANAFMVMFPGYIYRNEIVQVEEIKSP